PKISNIQNFQFTASHEKENDPIYTLVVLSRAVNLIELNKSLKKFIYTTSFFFMQYTGHIQFHPLTFFLRRHTINPIRKHLVFKANNITRQKDGYETHHSWWDEGGAWQVHHRPAGSSLFAAKEKEEGSRH
ncbi:TPA: hypothetical protein ACWXBJ_005376, partial [Klebsiella pneumoniae]